MAYVFLLLGIGLLAIGGELLVRGSLGAARRLGISPLLSGLIIVGFSTSSPELVVSLDAALRGIDDIAVGNIVGSNISNILLILGLCAMVTPMTTSSLGLRRDAVYMVLVTVLFVALAYILPGQILTAWVGLLFLLLLAVYMVWAYRTESTGDKKDSVHEAEAGEINPPTGTWMILFGCIGGLALLIVGSNVMLHGALEIAEQFSLPPVLIGLTLIAIGTSLPELTICLIAAVRGHGDVAVGNILGSNIFNILGVLGISALVKPLSISPQIISFDQWVMLGAAVALFIFLLGTRRLNRLEGLLLVAGYVVYVTFVYRISVGG